MYSFAIFITIYYGEFSLQTEVFRKRLGCFGCTLPVAPTIFHWPCRKRKVHHPELDPKASKGP